MIKKLIGLVAVLVVLGGGAFYWFVLRNPAPKKLTLDSGSSVTTTTAPGSSGTDSSSDDSNSSESSSSTDGTWNVQASASTTVGLRIQEKFVGGIAEHTAVGRTAAVTGSITVSGSTITKGSFTADLSAIEFTDSPPGLNAANRKQALQNSGLELAKFPDGTFTLTAPIQLGSVPKAGTPVTAKATGKLTLHGVTRTITFSVQAEILNGDIEAVSADPVPITLADYGMTPPTFGPVADVSKSGFFEFKLLMAKA